MYRKLRSVAIALLFVCSLVVQTVSADENNSNPPEEIEEAPLPNGQAMEVTTNTDEYGEVFDPTIQYPELEGKKQFLTFKTPENETYHIVVEYGRNSASTHVYLLKSVKEQEIENIATGNSSEQEEPTSNTFIGESKSSEEAKDKSKNVETQDESESSSIGQKLLIFGVVFIVVIAFYFLKKRNDSGNNYDDE